MENEQGFSKRHFPGYILKQRSDGALVIRPIPVSAKRVKTDPAFARTRQNAAEFGMVAKAGKLIRRAFVRWLEYADKREIGNRLTQVLMRVLGGDKINAHGSRKLTDGLLELLEGFQFSKQNSLKSRLPVSINVEQDATGHVVVDIPAGYKLDPSRFSSYKIAAVAVVIDLDTESVQVNEQSSEFIPVNQQQRPAIRLVTPMETGKGQLCLVAVGMQYYLNGGSDHLYTPSLGVDAVALGVVKCWRS